MRGSLIRFEYALLALGRRLTDQQLWCLGCDVRVRNFPLDSFRWVYHPRLADHESDVLALLGPVYRRRCIEQWKFRCSAVDPEEVPGAWRRIAHAVHSMRRECEFSPGLKVAV
jgi:hypothetical protein